MERRLYAVEITIMTLGSIAILVETGVDVGMLGDEKRVVFSYRLVDYLYADELCSVEDGIVVQLKEGS